uniref:Protein BCCIP homolog n=1 Tax=Glossina morsitans morsitans TaxID=37546 RepID=A0A1B0G8V1_GLOMM
MSEMSNDFDNDTEWSRDSQSDQPQPMAYMDDAGAERINFKGRTIEDRDWYSLCQLLQRLFMQANINCMKMADLIIAQNFLGSVIYQYDADGNGSDIENDIFEDSIIFGVITVLNISAEKDIPCIQQLRTFIMQSAEKYATEDVLKKFSDILNDTSRPVGYLINERLVNIPADISIGLLENLQTEIVTAEQKGMKFDFAYYLIIIKLYCREAKNGKPKEEFYTSAEEEFFVQKAISSFEYTMIDDSDVGMSGDWLGGEDAPPPYRKMLLFEADQIPNIIDELREKTQETK